MKSFVCLLATLATASAGVFNGLHGGGYLPYGGQFLHNPAGAYAAPGQFLPNLGPNPGLYPSGGHLLPGPGGPLFGGEFHGLPLGQPAPVVPEFGGYQFLQEAPAPLAELNTLHFVRQQPPPPPHIKTLKVVKQAPPPAPEIKHIKIVHQPPPPPPEVRYVQLIHDIPAPPPEVRTVQIIKQHPVPPPEIRTVQLVQEPIGAPVHEYPTHTQALVGEGEGVYKYLH